MTMSTGRNLITCATSFWLVIGIFVDGWAHRTEPSLETFFTPWHALFYSGFAAVAAWCIWNVYRNRKDSRSWKEAVPVGYLPALAGLVIFMIGGIGDMVWHVIFGIETDIDALLSPTHLFLFLGAAMVVTAPYRSFSFSSVETAPKFASFSAPLLSITLLMVLVSFMFMYLNAFDDNAILQSHARELQSSFGEAAGFVGFLSRKGGIAGILITNLILFASALLLVRRWKTPLGSFTIAFTVVATLIAALQEFSLYPFIISSLVGGLITDLSVSTLRPDRGPRELVVFGAIAPAVFWLVYMLAVMVMGMGWAVELWSGTIIWTGLSGAALAILMSGDQAFRPSR